MFDWDLSWTFGGGEYYQKGIFLVKCGYGQQFCIFLYIHIHMGLWECVHAYELLCLSLTSHST